MIDIWINENSGEIRCEKHSGTYLRSAITNKPQANRHVTPLGTWVRATADDMDEMAEWLNDTEPCEQCRYATVDA